MGRSDLPVLEAGWTRAKAPRVRGSGPHGPGRCLPWDLVRILILSAPFAAHPLGLGHSDKHGSPTSRTFALGKALCQAFYLN